MYPTLFTIGDIYISSFSFMVLIAFMVGYFVAESELKRKGLNGNLTDLLLIASVIGGLGGAKLLFLSLFWLPSFIPLVKENFWK